MKLSSVATSALLDLATTAGGRQGMLTGVWLEEWECACSKSDQCAPEEIFKDGREMRCRLEGTGCAVNAWLGRALDRA